MKQGKQLGFSVPHVLALLVLVLAVSGTGYYVYTNNKDNKSLSSEQPATTVELIGELPGNLLGIEKIKTLVSEDKPGMNISSIKLEKDGEVLVYIVRLSDGNKLVYNAQSGVKITGAKVENETEDSEDLPANFSVAIDIAKAYEIALAQNPGGKLKEVELDNEGGKIVYKFQFSTGSEIKISAADGSIVKAELKNESGEDKKSSNEGSSRSLQEDGDLDNDGVKNNQDSDDDNDGTSDNEDSDDDNDGENDNVDSDDDNDDVDDDDDKSSN